MTKSDSDLIEAHGAQFIYLACVVCTGNRSTSVDVRPQPCSLFEHFLVLFILRMQRGVVIMSLKNKWSKTDKIHPFIFLSTALKVMALLEPFPDDILCRWCYTLDGSTGFMAAAHTEMPTKSSQSLDSNLLFLDNLSLSFLHDITMFQCLNTPFHAMVFLSF